MFVFTCRRVWVKCSLLPTHVQMRSCRSSSVLRKGILIWISNHMEKSHMGNDVASSSILCPSLLAQIHSNFYQWLTQVCAVHTHSLKGCTNSPLGCATWTRIFIPYVVLQTSTDRLSRIPVNSLKTWISELKSITTDFVLKLLPDASLSQGEWFGCIN